MNAQGLRISGLAFLQITNAYSMHLEILTPEKKIFEGEVSIATFPGADGSFQVMDHHAPLISLLKEGVVEYKVKEGRNTITITGGVVEVLKNKTILLADSVVV
jgi:F-type H+-transporting ATPase subunit epsilon